MFDLIIKNGAVIDGTGSPAYYSDIAIANGKIVRISRNITDESLKIIDARGLTVTPGFIDSHSHSDGQMFEYPDMIHKIEQGITTSVAGQCGISFAPGIIDEKNDKYAEGIGKLSDAAKSFGNFAKAMQGVSFGSNNVCFVGHGNIRRVVMGMSQEKPTEKELEDMKAHVREAMENGALGLSFGLIYPPGSYADTDELVELAKIVKEYNGLISAHIRSESDKLAESVKEFIEVVRRTGVRGIISHHKACGSNENHGKVTHTLRLIDQANEEGLDVYLDVYPYEATHTSASVTFVHDSGRSLMERLASEEERAKMREVNKTKWWAKDYSWIQVADCKGYPQYEGMFVPDIARIHGKDEYETILDMIYESNNECTCCYFTICDEDVKRVISHPRAMICTDGSGSIIKGQETFHPRNKGSFPRALGRYVREKKVISLYEMIRKMTSMPARVYGLNKKGLIWEGMDADICIFDADKIIDRADFSDCNRRAEGLNYVILGGEVVVEDAVHNGVKKGNLILV